MEERRKPRHSDVDIASHRHTERRKKLLFWGLGALVILLPLPLGGGRQMAWEIMGLYVALLLAGSITLPFRDYGAIRRDLKVPVLLVTAVACFAVIQSSSLTPAGWHNPIWTRANEALDGTAAGMIGVDRRIASTYLLRILSYVGAFLLGVFLCRDPRRANRLIMIVTLCGGAYAAYGLLVYWSGNRTLLWLAKWTYGDDLTGTFVNRNSFATYLGLCTLTALTQLGAGLAELHLYGRPRDRARIIIEFLSARWWVLAMLFLLITALFLTHSRGGLFSTLIGAMTLLLAMSWAPSLGKFGGRGLGTVPAVLALVAFAISGDKTVERMIYSGQEGAERVAVYRQVVKAILDFPVFGTGLGSFFSVFPRYRTPEILGYYDLAHNDYLQNILELGIPAAVCLFAAILWPVGLCIRGIRVRRRDAMLPCLGIAATVLVGVHATVDFSLQIPAVTVTYAVLLGAAVAQSRSLRRDDKKPADTPPLPKFAV